MTPTNPSPETSQSARALIAALEEARRREFRAAELYRMLGTLEKDPQRRIIFGKLADEEAKHARLFGERISELGGTPGPEGSPLSSIDRLLARTAGANVMLRRMEAEEEKNIAYFDAQASVIGSDPTTQSLFEMVEGEEQHHADMLAGMKPDATPSSRLDAMMRREKWHVTTGSWIGDAIYGVNDGLGAVFGIVSGVSGYSGGGHEVAVAGIFGMLASALSMGSGAYLAAKSEREVHEAELGRERREIVEDPDHEREELALIYQLKGLSEEDSHRVAAAIAADPDTFLKAMAQEELGLSDRHFRNPWTALMSASLSTALGAIIPVLPFFFTSGMHAVIASAIISTAAHFAVGAAKSIVTTRSWFASGLEMTIVGIIEAVVAYGLGLGLGSHKGR